MTTSTPSSAPAPSTRSWRPESAALALALGLCAAAPYASAQGAGPWRPRVGYTANAWRTEGLGAIRGATVGPIESSQHPGVGYGTPASEETFGELRALGCNWVSLTPFGRSWNLRATDIQLDFEAPFSRNRADVVRAIGQAHAQGLRVLLIPHLWIEAPLEDGHNWRGELDPGSDARWDRWFAQYTRFLLTWARVAEEGGAEMLSVGVELKSTSDRFPARWFAMLEQVRRVYHGLLTYSANWDEEPQVAFWDRLDVVGINAFYPLAEREGAGLEQLREGARARAERLEAWALRTGRSVLFTEFGYTARPDPAVRPWEWPDSMQNVRVDEHAQAVAYRALLEAFAGRPWFAGAFVWRYYANPMDASQESAWGFSPRLREAEGVLRELYGLRWGSDPEPDPGLSPSWARLL